MENPHEQAQNALLSRIINNMVSTVKCGVIAWGQISGLVIFGAL